MQAELLDILASSSDAIYEVDRDGRIKSWNRAAAHTYQWTEQEAVGQAVAILTDEPLAPVRDHRACHRRKDGQAIPVVLTAAEHASGLLVLARQSDPGSLREEESARLAAIVHSSDDAIVSLSDDGVVRTWNRGAEITCGWRSDEAIGKPIWDLVSAFSPRFLGDVRQHHAHGERLAPMEMACVGKGGRTQLLRVHLSPLRRADGSLSGTSIIARDVTGLRMAEDELAVTAGALQLKNESLEDTNQELQRAHRMKNRVLASMHHELRTPLNAILGFTELLHSGLLGEVSDEQRECLGHVITASGHLLRLIEDILELASFDAELVTLCPAPVDVVELIHDVVRSHEPDLRRKAIDVRVEADESARVLLLDGKRLRHVLHHYVQNAVKFTPERGRIELRYSRDGEHVRIEVEDTGPGIPPDDTDRIFRIFEQAAQPAELTSAGMGLGLAICKRTVEAMGGQVGVRSVPGEGSVFSATLPLTPVTDGYQAPRVLSRERHVLVVANGEELAHLSRTLEDASCQVSTAGTGLEALALCDGYRPDIIYLSLQLPDMRGWDLLRRFEMKPELASTPIVVIAGRPLAERTHRLQIHDVLMRPLDPSAVLASLRALESHLGAA